MEDLKHILNNIKVFADSISEMASDYKDGDDIDDLVSYIEGDIDHNKLQLSNINEDKKLC